MVAMDHVVTPAEIKEADNFIKAYKLSESGANVPGVPLLAGDKIDWALLWETRSLIRAYFKKSGQKGLGLNEVRGECIKPTVSEYVSRGMVYLAFLLEGYELQKDRALNPNIRCRYINIKVFSERNEHIREMNEYNLNYQVTPAVIGKNTWSIAKAGARTASGSAESDSVPVSARATPEQTTPAPPSLPQSR